MNTIYTEMATGNLINRMAKKKKYTPKEDDDWDMEAAIEHRKIITEKEKAIKNKYKKWWDQKNKKWKEGFSH